MEKPRLTPISIAVALALPTSGLNAQTNESAIEEITVTASRREQSILDVPYNITAVSGQELESRGVTDVREMIRMVPGLNTFDDGARGSGTRSNITLRGLNAEGAFNQDDNPRISQPTVSTYVGETPVYFPLKLVDLERVEVLRGPQGTLYGAGSVGGTVRFIPKKADTDAFSFDVAAQKSTTDESDETGYDAHFVLNAPFSDTAAIRVTAGQEHVAGFIDAAGRVEQAGTDRNPGAVIPADPNDVNSPAIPAPLVEDSNDADITHARVDLRFTPSDTVDINFAYHYQNTEANDRSDDNTMFGTGEEYVNYTGFRFATRL